MKLNEAKLSEWLKVIKVNGEGDIRHHLLDMGVIPGTIIRIDKYAPMGDPIEIFFHGY